MRTRSWSGGRQKRRCLVNGTNGAMQVFSGGDFPITSGGFKIIFKNARITADRVIIEPIQPKKPGADKK